MAAETKRQRFALGTRSENLAQALQPPGGEDAGFEEIPMDRVEPDPQNPRVLHLDPVDPRNIADDDPDRETKLRELESIEELAQSVRQVGVIQPIKVYRVGHQFRIAMGERRWLASKLAEKATIPAVVLKERPPRLRLEQLVENLHRKGLNLHRRVENLRMVIHENGEAGDPITTGDSLATVTGLSRTQAYQYWAIIKAPKDVLVAVEKGIIESLDVAAEIARIPDPVLRSASIAAGKAVTAGPADRGGTPQKPRERGRPKSIRFGSTPRLDVARRIIEAVAGEDQVEVDWTDPVAVSKAFRALLKALEEGKL